MTEADVPQVVAIQEPASVASLAFVFPQGAFPFPREDVARRWRHEINTPGIDCYVVVAADAVIGLAAIQKDEVLHFGIAIEYWGTGVAQQAHDALLGLMRSRGITRAWLRVFTGNGRGRAFYERLGWRPTGERTHSTFAPNPELLHYERDFDDDQGVLPVDAMVDRLGRTFAIFDARTQDSGHVSYGVIDDQGRRWFVKTAGDDTVSPGGATRQERAAALRHAAAIQHGLDHPALVPVEAVIEASDGIAILYRWFDGELLRSPAERRDDPAEAHSRFRALPAPEVATALDSVIDLHVVLERAGWIAGDFYDGCLMYDFDARVIKVIDLEAYHRGSYINEVGRLPGSTRFMAPEEYTKSAAITASTTVYNLGRMLDIFLPTKPPAIAAAVARATATAPEARPSSVAQLQREWLAALPKKWGSGITSGVVVEGSGANPAP